ncbi:hypothetical protein [Sphingomonas baiyangensis]|uniref:Uncharacterized protein n=1 Tax=Sphingomonas baiyangensis TaxID=2572576 RepID=A0A4U1L5L2_9SPHN|nr:hypothetical protein [Sphingomonas baiyangensis]TKD51854.1 hypothetical protein FBR43_14715 [Sphingomonas baiyangensis]
MRDLDDPEYAAFAWARFRRILWGMAALACVSAAVGVAVLWWWLGRMPLHMGIATALGIGLTVLMGGLLMGLVFLSSGSGHDESVDRFNADRDPGRDFERDS